LPVVISLGIFAAGLAIVALWVNHKFERAYNLLKDDRFAEAANEFEMLAALGHSRSQYQVARMRAFGFGLARDFGEANRFLQRATRPPFPIEGSLGELQFYIGRDLTLGTGGPPDPSEGKRWLKLATDNGFNRALR
jgi:TPR repeat protein